MMLVLFFLSFGRITFAQNDEEIKILQDAFAHYQNGDKEKAILGYTDAINKYPNSYYGYLYRGSIYGEQEKYALAIADSKKLMDYYPDDPVGYINATAYLMTTGRFGESKEYAFKAFELGKYSWYHVWVNLAGYYWWAGDIANAKLYLLETVERMPTVEDYEATLKSLNELIEKGYLNDNNRLIYTFTSAWSKSGVTYMQIQKHDKQAIAYIDKKDHNAAALENKKISDLAMTLDPPNLEMAMEYAEYEANQCKIVDKTDLVKEAYNRMLKYIIQGNVITFNAGANANAGGLFFKDNYDYVRAVSFYDQADQIFEQIKNEDWQASTSSNLGEVYNFIGEYKKSLDYYTKAIQLGEKVGDESGLAITYNNISSTYANIGQYDMAIKMAKKSVAMGEKLGHKALSSFYSSLGNRYYTIGDYESALSNFEKALALDKKSGEKSKIAQRLGSIGTAYMGLKKRNLAEQKLKESVRIAEEMGSVLDIAAGSHNLGMIAKDRKKSYEAKAYFEKALAIYQKHGIERESAADLMILGQLYNERFDDSYKGEQYLKKAEVIYKKLGLKFELSELYYHLGGVYSKKGNNVEAIRYVKLAISNFEATLSKNSDLSRSQLSASIKQYAFLAALYGISLQFEDAFNTIEKSKATNLATRLADGNVSAVNVRTVQNQMPSNTAMINYMNAGYGVPLYVTIANDRVSGFMTKSADESGAAAEKEFNNLLSKYETKSQLAMQNQRGFKATKPTVAVLGDQALFSFEKFENLINYYRILIVNEGASGVVIAEKEEIARGLYNYLIKPIEQNFVGKQKLIIIPEGILGYLPFETLIAPDGKYLIEKYDIQYVQSATVWHLINQRKYSADRRDLLAFGGAQYENTSSSTEQINTEDGLEKLKSAMNKPGTKDYRPLYKKLGISNWQKLPGTEKEVNQLKVLFPNAVVNYECNASENTINTLNKNGQLDDFKVIHFATHGVVVPAIPDLSALVLAQGCSSEYGDGYLTTKEIEKLDIKADFVNLSACETGLGKIYGGEGVVGLTQSFLIAGANGLSVSLWQVADESTSQFMIGLYKENKNGKAYNASISEMKRKFINGEYGAKNALPYYWAPFVYYGK